MRAWQLTRLGDPWDELEAVEVDPPEPGEGQARIEVEGADVNFADILQCQGSYQVKIDVPFVPGMSAAGTVVAVGPGSGLSVGQRVVGSTSGAWGGFATEAIVHGADVHPLPDDVDGVVAAGLHVTYGTAWFALHRRGHLAPGESVLVLAAAGGVGSAAVQLAKAHGCWVLGAAGGPDKVRAVTELGADLAFDYDPGPGEPDLHTAVMEATSGRGVDVVYDPVGGAYFDVARRLVAWEGRLLVVGFASGTIPAAPANHLLVKNYSVVGVHMGGYRAMDPAVITRCYDEVYAQLARGEIDPLITERLGFDGLPEGLRRLAERRTVGRIVVDPRG
ncbi:MAG: NADPH:quinone oxidoreductase family protein [Acidimicrobiales bacterium]